MRYEWILIALYILALIVIGLELLSMLAITVVFIMLILMVIVQGAGLEKDMRSNEDERNKKLNDVALKVDDISRRFDNFKDDVNRQVVFVDNKVTEVRHFVEGELVGIYGELSRKLTSIDDRIGELRQTLAASVGSLDERIRNMEKCEERKDSSEF